MAKITFVVKAEAPEEDLSAIWANPADYLLAGHGEYYGSSDVSVYRVDGIADE